MYSVMRCFQMQHTTHHMKAEKEAYSQSKPTRSVRNNPTENKRQGKGMIEIGF